MLSKGPRGVWRGVKPAKERVRQTYMPLAFMSIATSSRAPMPRPPTASRKLCSTTNYIGPHK